MGKDRAVAGALLLFLSASPAAATCAPDRIDFQTSGGVAAFAVEVVDDEQSRARGLMFREEMADDAGMLFVYPSAREVAFWMKNTPLSLDIVFLNRRGVICSIAEATTPHSLETIPSRCAAQTVLEVKAGIAAAAGLKRGAPARHPAIEAPVWACE